MTSSCRSPTPHDPRGADLDRRLRADGQVAEGQALPGAVTSPGPVDREVHLDVEVPLIGGKLADWAKGSVQQQLEDEAVDAAKYSRRMDANPSPTVFPEIHYRDARAAIATLTEAFGFTERMVVDDEAGGILHAELTHGNGLVMLGSAGPDDPIGGTCLCIVVEDPDEHHRQVASRGVEIVTAPFDTPFGARSYSARDLDGNVWVFSTYQPFAGESSSNS